MTAEAFYAALAEKTQRTNQQWFLCAGAVRTGANSRGHCPLSFVAETDPCFGYTAALVLKIQAKTADHIVCAADYDPARCPADMPGRAEAIAARAAILNACGLEEPCQS